MCCPIVINLALGAAPCYTLAMQINKGATQQELEHIAKRYARQLYRDVLQLRLRAQLVIAFLCLLNPPSIFGFFMIGAVMTAIFACFLAWAYTNNEPQLLQKALIWWYVWAATVYLINFVLRALLCRKLARHLNHYKDADLTNATPIPTPQHYSLRWEKDEDATHWQNLVLFHAPQRGLYALELVIENYNGTLESPPEGACATHTDEIAGDRIRYVALYRLEQGNHWLATSLSNAEGDEPEAYLTLLNTDLSVS